MSVRLSLKRTPPSARYSLRRAVSRRIPVPIYGNARDIRFIRRFFTSINFIFIRFGHCVRTVFLIRMPSCRSQCPISIFALVSISFQWHLLPFAFLPLKWSLNNFSVFIIITCSTTSMLFTETCREPAYTCFSIW